MKVPETLNFGFGEMYEVSYLEGILKITRRTAIKYLRALKIEPLYFGNKIFYSHQTFCRILFVLSKPGSNGFIFPGSSRKTAKFMKDKGILTEVTDEILKEAADPKTLAEMNACDGSNPNILKQFITKPVGRPKKENE